jgi:hypothetical protein
MLARQAPMTRITAFNAYSHAHVTGPLDNGALRRLGGVVYDRSQHPEEFFPTLAQTELFDFDTLVIPAQTVRGMDEDGHACAQGGTQIPRLPAGDGATLLDERCACGLTTPRLRGIQRVGMTG